MIDKLYFYFQTIFKVVAGSLWHKDRERILYVLSTYHFVCIYLNLRPRVVQSATFSECLLEFPRYDLTFTGNCSLAKIKLIV